MDSGPNYTIDRWSPDSSPSGASPSSSPPSNNGDSFAMRYQGAQQNGGMGRNRTGSDAAAYKPSTRIDLSTSAPSRNFNMANSQGRNGYYHNHHHDGRSSFSTFMEQVKALGPFQPGMKEVPIWLKSLRLHKYTPMFQPMTYAEMMALDEQTLEARQVTKGARKKILQSIAKLKERVSNIKQLEKTIDDNGDPRCLIVELRAMMNTPIAKYSMENSGSVASEDFQAKLDAISLPAEQVDEENLPGHIVRVLYRLHNHLFGGAKNRMELEDEYILKMLQTYDKILNSESFTANQKKHISTSKRLLRNIAIDRDILPYNSERRHTFSSGYVPKQQRLRRTSVNSFSSPYSTFTKGKHSPPMSSTPSPPPSSGPYYTNRRQSFTFNNVQTGGASRPAPWYRPNQQSAHPGQQSPPHTPPQTPPGFGQNKHSPVQSPASQTSNQGYVYPVQQQGQQQGQQAQMSQFYQPYMGDQANLQAIFSALTNPQVLELIKNLSTKPQPSQLESQQAQPRQMVSQGIQAGTPDIKLDPPSYVPPVTVAANLADELQFSNEDKQKFIQSVLNEALSSPLPEEGSKLPALSQLHQKTGKAENAMGFKTIQQPQAVKPPTTQAEWWNSNTTADQKTGSTNSENSTSGPTLMIPPVGYLAAHQEFVNKLWEPIPATPPVNKPMTPQIDSKPLFALSPSVQFRQPQPPIGTGANRNHSSSSSSSTSNANGPNQPPFDFSSLLMAPPLRL